VRQLPGLQVNQDKALKDVIVKNQVNAEMLGIGVDPLLTRYEGEALA
jgi:hypothetical protein